MRDSESFDHYLTETVAVELSLVVLADVVVAVVVVVVADVAAVAVVELLLAVVAVAAEFVVGLQ